MVSFQSVAQMEVDSLRIVFLQKGVVKTFCGIGNFLCFNCPTTCICVFF